MMTLAYSLAIDVLGVAVAATALCRLAPMHLVTHTAGGRRVRYRPEWVLVYLLMFVGALFALLDLWMGEPNPSAIPLLAGAALYLWLSRVTWRDGPPAHTRIEEST